MSNWKRITLVVFVLIGGTMAFGYWSRYQFNSALSDLEAALTANLVSSPLELEKNTKLASTSPEISEDTKLASTSPEISEALASSSKETTPLVTSTMTAATTPVTASSSIDRGLSFTFPQTGDEVYIGCTYPISWQSSTTINSLGTILVDAGAKEVIDPTASGLAKESVIETDSQNLKWKVGVVWPGKYYIKIFKINDANAKIRSKVFTINSMPKGINTDEREKICNKSAR